MRSADIRLLFDYGYWATGRILDAAAAIGPDQYTAPASASHGSLQNTLVHLLASEITWRRRCQEAVSPTSLPTVADFPSFGALRTAWQQEQTAMLSFLEDLDDAAMDNAVHYRTTKGVAQQSSLWHILAHVVNHGTQHRAEAAMLLTALGHSPGDIDLILYLRQRQAA